MNLPLNQHNINNIMDSILINSNITFYNKGKGQEPYLTYDRIYFGNNNEISRQRLEEIKHYLNNEENNTNRNYTLFFKYLAKFEDEIKKQFKND